MLYQFHECLLHSEPISLGRFASGNSGIFSFLSIYTSKYILQSFSIIEIYQAPVGEKDLDSTVIAI